MFLETARSEANLISVLIPNWDGASDTVECLESLAFQDYGSSNLEIIIVDNGSEDGSVGMIRTKLSEIGGRFRRYVLIELEQNQGIATAYNVAYKNVLPDAFAVLRLDNDVLLPPDAVSKLVVRLKGLKDVAIVGCRITSYDRSPKMLHHFGAVYVDRWSGKSKVFYPDSDVMCDGVAGCTMLIDNQAIKRLVYFFEPFRFLANELDLCQRVKQLGGIVLYTPFVEVFHKGAKSSSKIREFIHFEILKEGYLFHLRYSKPPALVYYMISAILRSVIRYIGGDASRLRALREAWIEACRLRSAIDIIRKKAEN